MSDPPRLLDAPDELDDKEFGVLTAGRDAVPQPSLRGEVWAGLALRAPIAAALGKAASGGAAAQQAGGAGAGAGSAAGASSAGVAGAGLSAIAKAVVIGATAGSLVVGGVALTTAPPSIPKSAQSSKAHAASPTARSSRAAPARPASSADRERAEPVLPDPDAEAAPRSAVAASAKLLPKTIERPSTDAPAPPTSVKVFPEFEADRGASAQEESRLVANARERLREHDVEGARRELERARASFPSGVLVQEREALWIEALAEGGHGDQARARATAFLRAYPKSPHAARVRAVAGW